MYLPVSFRLQNEKPLYARDLYESSSHIYLGKGYILFASYKEITLNPYQRHRPKSFPWKYNETARGCVLLKEVLAAQITALADHGVVDFLSGMALGMDLWSAKVVLDLQKNYPAIAEVYSCPT